MPILDFFISKEKLISKPFKERIIANSINYLEINFSFDKEDNSWENLEKFAEFNWNRQSYIVDLQRSLKFYVPWQVIKIPGFSVNVFGQEKKNINSEQQIVKRITTNVVPVKVYPSGNLQGLFADEEMNELYITVAEEALDNSEQAKKVATESAAKVDKLRQDLDSLSTNIAAAVSLSQDFQTFKTQVEKRFVENKEQIDNISEGINKNTDELIALQQEIDNIKEKIEELEAQEEQLEIVVSNIQEIQKIYENNFQKLSQQILDYFNEESSLWKNVNDNQIKLMQQNEEFKSELETLQDENNLLTQNIEELESKIQELDNISKKPIKKEDTDFIYYTDLNLIQNLYDGALDLDTGAEIENNEYKRTDYIKSSSDVFVTNYSNFDVCFYKKSENENDIEDSEDKSVDYDFISSIHITTTSFLNNSQSNYFRLSIPVENAYSFVLEEGNKYIEDSSYYQFDYTLEEAINKLIDNKVGNIISADY